MKHRYSIALIAILSISTLAFAGKKERQWKTGKLVDSANETFTRHGGTNTQGHVNSDGTYTAGTSQVSWEHEKFIFTIRGDDMIYVVSHVISFRWSKKVELTVNGPVKYAVEKRDFYLVDENGREFKMKIEKKILIEEKQ